MEVGLEGPIGVKPEGGHIGDDGENTCLVQGSKVFLRKASDRVRKDTKACGRGSCPVAEYPKMMVEGELLIKEDAQPPYYWGGTDGAVWEYERAKEVRVLSSREMNQLEF